MSKFAKMTEAKYEDGYIRFVWGEENEKQRYEISSDALLQSFGATGSSAVELLNAFENGRDRIVDAAQQARNTPTDGVIELGSGDFDQKVAKGSISPL